MFGMKTYSKLGDEFDVGRRQQFSLHCAHNNSFLFMYDTYTYLPLYPDMIKETMVVFYLKPFLLTHHPQVAYAEALQQRLHGPQNAVPRV